MAGLYEHGLLRTWYRHRPEGWTLVSGLWSPLYLQLRELCSYPDLLETAGQALGELANEAGEFSALVGIAFGGIPLAISASLSSGIPAAMTRKLEARGDAEMQDAIARYGDHSLVEGALSANGRIALVDDLVTRFDSKLAAARQLEAEVTRRGLDNVECRDVIVLVDREQGAEEVARNHGFRLHSVIRLRGEGLEWLRPQLSLIEYDVLSEYFAEPDLFQDPSEQERLRALAGSQ